MKKIQVVLVFLFACGGFIFAQSFDPAQFAAVQKQNSESLKNYTWKQRMELQLKGETKKVTLNLMRYDASGNKQQTLLSEEPKEQEPQQSSRRGGRIKSKIVEKKKGEFKELMEGLGQLVQSYSNIPPEKLKAALSKAEKFPGQGDMQGTAGIRLSGVLQKKDSLTIWVDPATLLFRRIEVSSSYDEKPVALTANFSTIPGGPNYMAQSTLSYPEKELMLRVDNFDYH